ncbi:MAG: histidine kinase dimerization/phosphoacceptor domain -containing protein [Bacteroidia bacterium]|nr:histidine kinase dimerization/phosphoacceptor domain -containing protein [Bacteroidia bacterium]
MPEELDDIYNIVSRLTGGKSFDASNKKEAILSGLSKIEKKLKSVKAEKKKNASQINEILGVVLSLAQLNYTKKAAVSGKKNDFDALALGINMLGEELQSSTISLREKEVLLKEIHHRVKNNLQVISSLLNLQSEKITQPDLLETFMESKNRIRAMALVHEKLYQSDDLSKIDFTEYMHSFLTYMDNSHNLNPEKVQIHVNAITQSHFFKIDIAIPCGLILNELISNSFKYAFPDMRKGNIHLYFGIEKKLKTTNQYILEVADDGIGIPLSVDMKNPNSLGLQLLEMLTQQLGGTLALDRTNGTKFTVRFPIS